MRLPQYTNKYHAMIAGALILAEPAAAETLQADSTFTLGTVEIIGTRETTASQATDVVDAETLAARQRDDLPANRQWVLQLSGAPDATVVIAVTAVADR